MKPKHHRDFLEGIDKKVGVHPDVVKDFVTFFYSKVRRNLSDLTHPYINIEGLGLFSLRKGKLDGDVKKYKKFISSLDLNVYGDYEKNISAKKHLANLERALADFEKILADKRNFKQKQNESKESN